MADARIRDLRAGTFVRRKLFLYGSGHDGRRPAYLMTRSGVEIDVFEPLKRQINIIRSRCEREGIKNTEIVRCRPRLAICIYHKDDDLAAIGDYVLKLMPDSKVYIRHYTSDFGETVMYFEPKREMR